MAEFSCAAVDMIIYGRAAFDIAVSTADDFALGGNHLFAMAVEARDGDCLIIGICHIYLNLCAEAFICKVTEFKRHLGLIIAEKLRRRNSMANLKNLFIKALCGTCYKSCHAEVFYGTLMCLYERGIAHERGFLCEIHENGDSHPCIEVLFTGGRYAVIAEQAVCKAGCTFVSHGQAGSAKLLASRGECIASEFLHHALDGVHIIEVMADESVAYRACFRLIGESFCFGGKFFFACGAVHIIKYFTYGMARTADTVFKVEPIDIGI